MKRKTVLISLAALSLLFTGIVGCGNKPEEKSEEPSSVAPTTSETAKPSSQEAKPSSSAAPTTSEAPAPHVHTYGDAIKTAKNASGKDVFIKECADKDDKYIGIAFDDYSEKSADFGSTSSYNNVPEALRNESRLLAKNSTVTWKINVDKAIQNAELEFGVVYTGSDHGTQTGADGSTQKYSIKANDGEFQDWALGSTTYDEAGLSQTARAYLKYGNINLVAGENTITLRQNNAGYRLLYGGEVRIHFTGDATIEDGVVPFEGYTVNFVIDDNCEVFVYQTKAYDTETPVKSTTAIARNENGEIVAYDPDDLLLQPQCSFKVVCKDGYSVNATNIVVTPEGSFKNLKQNPDNVVGQENIFRVTKIQANITITITPVAGEQAPGYKVDFVPAHCTIKVYVGPKDETGSNVDTAEVIYARGKDSPYDVTFTTPQVNFEVICEEGYEFVPTITDDKVDFIQGDYNKFQIKTSVAGDYYNITKVASDLTITIAATLIAGE